MICLECMVFSTTEEIMHKKNSMLTTGSRSEITEIIEEGLLPITLGGEMSWKSVSLDEWKDKDRGSF